MISSIRLLSFSFFLPFLIVWQESYLTNINSTNFCAQQLIHENLWQQYPEKKDKHLAFEERLLKYIKKNNGLGSLEKADYTIPVVVHIIHDNGAENINDATVIQGIQHLNDAFENVGYYDQNTGVNTGFAFCLARRDPDGNATTGITRTVSTLTDMVLEDDDITVKDLSRWDPTQYVNIWLVREICSNAAGCGVAGYAYFPASHGAAEDGIMMEANWFGSDPGSSSVIVHEMGHYFGVYHTFQGGCPNNDCLSDGDRVCDTPPDNSTAPVPCNGTMNSCSTDTDSGFTTDENDMFWNYMDYGDWNCYSAFTQGQTDRMVFTIENVRQSLLDSKGCLDPCMSQLTASFTADMLTLEVGGTVNFANTSTNSTSANWTMNGLTFANTTDASYTFNQVGYFEICVEIGNADPNCSDQFCLQIEVTCPVVAEFVTDNFYPLPGQQVNYTNQSQNATQYEWQVDGFPQGTTANFNWIFPNEGIYDVCLISADGLCETEFCLPVFVSTDPVPPGDCDTTFLKTFGTPNSNEFGSSIIAAPNGGFLIAGRFADQAMIALLDANADIVWTRQFDPTSDPGDAIWEIKLDSDNNIIGIGQGETIGNNIEVFAFKYDWQNDNLIWLNELDIADPAGEGYFEILEKAPGGNYYIFGQQTDIGNTESDALLLEVNRNTGLNVFAKTYSLGWRERFVSAVIFNNSIYATGDYSWSANSGKIRPGLTRLDLNGNQIWSRLYLESVLPNVNASLFPTDLLEDNGLVVYGYGNSGPGSGTNKVFLFRTDASGALEWAKEIDMPGAVIELTSRLINLPDGYLCLGSVYYTADADVFIFKTDKQGNLLWSKRYGDSEVDVGLDFIWQDGLIFITGITDSGATNDVLLAAINDDGSSTATDSCNLLSDHPITLIDWPTPYDAQHDLTEVSVTANFFNNISSFQAVLMEQLISCANPCNDSCDLRPDAQFESAIAFCGGDSMLIELTICNTGNFVLPENTPIIFYDGNPTTTAVPVWHIDSIPQKIKRDSCLILEIKMPAISNVEVFIMINDGGTTPTPFNLLDENDFPNTDIIECDYTNNIGSFEINFTPPPLDLGPDIMMCENGVIELDAGPGFYRYRWQDGDEEQTYTAFFPGTYSVEVMDSCGGIQMDEITVTIDPASIVDLGNDTLVCEGDTLFISLNGFDKYEWFPKNVLSCDTCANIDIFPAPNDTVEVIVVASTDAGCYSVDTIAVGTTTPVFTSDTLLFCPGDTVFLFNKPVTEAGEYVGVFDRETGCDSTHTTILEAIANLILVLPDDLTIELGDSVRLNPVTNGQNLNWQWSPPDGLSCNNCEHPYARPLETTLYALVISDENGCNANDEILLTVSKNRNVFIPNAFSPNDDGVNDIFHIFARGDVSQVLEFKIFDRWGELVFADENFQPNDPAHGWDGIFRGKTMNPAVFAYLAKVEYVDGVVELFKGDVTLIR